MVYFAVLAYFVIELSVDVNLSTSLSFSILRYSQIINMVVDVVVNICLVQLEILRILGLVSSVLWHINLGLAKNYRGITLTSIAAKIYNALLRNRIEPKIDNILRKNQNGFRRNRSTTSQILVGYLTPNPFLCK